MIAKPNTEQSIQGSMAGQTRQAIVKYIREELDDCLPARVVSYDDATNRAVIHPICMLGTTGGQKVSRAQIANIPVFRFGGGGFFMRFPLKPGDLGWLKATDRDISLIMQAGAEEWPNTTRLHSFSDALFFPDTLKGWVIDGEFSDAAVWQSLDGSTVIALADDKITLKQGGTKIEVSAAGVAMEGPPGGLTYNGVNVGDTHVHVGPPTAPPGPVSQTGVPL